MNLVKRNYSNFPSIIDEFLKPDWFGGFQNFQTNIPAVNIKESDTNYSLELAAPGKGKDDFIIEIDHNVLTISSEVKTENEQKDDSGRYTRREFGYAAFSRAFTLPDTVNTEDINANYENGVLYVTIPKKQEALPKSKRLIAIL